MFADPATLPEDPVLLKRNLADLQLNFEKKTRILREVIQFLRVQLYGRKSEKTIPLDAPQPLPLFDMSEPADTEEEKEEIHFPGHTQKKGAEGYLLTG